MQGWVKIHRKLAEWGWASSHKHLALFLHLLLRANHKETKWRKETIYPGQLLTGRKQLSKWTGLSQQSIRTVLMDLKSTNEITIKTTNHYSIITVTNWIRYQLSNQQSNQQVTNGQPTSNHIQECKELKNVKKDTLRIPFKDIAHSYNEELGEILGLCEIPLEQKQRNAIKKSWKKLPDIESWKSYFESIKEMPFLMGEKTDWMANFDWLIGPVNSKKVLNGNYKQKTNMNGGDSLLGSIISSHVKEEKDLEGGH